MFPRKKYLSVFSLAMITVVAVDSLRALPIGSQYGFSIIFYYLIATLVFFLPSALVAAELATGWPEQGGIYVWVKVAFGKKIAFFTIWLQWFYNICWYPTLMSFIAATFAYCIDAHLVQDKTYMLIMALTLFWTVTCINFLGMQISALLINLAAIVGTIFPILFIITLGIFWIIAGKSIAIEVSWQSFFPDITQMNNLVLLIGILFGLLGMENAAAHANEVQHPQRDYPKALAWAAGIILITLMFGSLAIAVIVPHKQLSVIAGLLQAYELFFTKFHLTWLLPLLAILISLGSLGGLNAWLLSPSKGLLLAAKDGYLPCVLQHVNNQGVPTRILLLQAIIFTLLCLLFLLMPTVSSSYWLLSAVTSILALIVYIPLFLAAIRLRYLFPEQPRAFKIPGNLWGTWIVCLLGLGSCLFAIMIGFLPPSQIKVGDEITYIFIVTGGVLVSCLIPIAICYFCDKKMENVV